MGTYIGGYNPQGSGGSNPWVDLGIAVLDTVGDIFTKDFQPGQNSSSPGNNIILSNNTPTVNQGTWFDDLFGGGSTINIFGMEVPRTVLLIAIAMLLFRKQLKRMI